MSNIVTPSWLERKLERSTQSVRDANIRHQALKQQKADPVQIAAAEKVIEIMKRTHLGLIQDAQDILSRPASQDKPEEKVS